MNPSQTIKALLESYEHQGLNDVPEDSVIRNCQYQAFRKTKERLGRLLTSGHTRGDYGSYVIQMATGTGKSGVIGLLSTCLPAPYMRILVVTPSDGLRSQLRQVLDTSPKKSKTYWTTIGLWPEDVTVKMCSEATDMPEPNRRDGRFVTITTVQLLHSYRRANGSKLQRHYDLIIFDEGHKKPSQEWDKTVDNLNVPVILLTATPYRSDGKSLRSEIIFRYTFSDARTPGSEILKSVRFHHLDFRSDMTQAVRSIETKLAEIHDDWNSKKHSPKAIIRASSAAEVKKITNFLNSLGHKAVGVHSRFKTAKGRRLVSSKAEIPSTARYIVHQHILLEGYDDPEIAVAVFLDESEDARVFIQQIGRAVRRISDFPEETIQQAHIYSPNRKAADQTWKSYLAFESAPDQYVYRGSEFVPKLGTKGLEVSDSLNFRMAVQIKTGFQSNHDSRRDLYDETLKWIRKQAEFRNPICERNEDPGHFPWMLFVFEKISAPSFLSGTSFENVKLEYMLFSFSRNHVFIQASVARFPATIQELELADPGVLTRIVPSTKLNISSIQLRNIVEAVGTVRARSFWADNANRHLSPSRDGTYAPHALRWWNSSDELNESISLNSARYSSGEVLNLSMFLDWCDDLDKKLKSSVADSHGVFQQLARKSRTTPGTPYLIRIEMQDFT